MFKRLAIAVAIFLSNTEAVEMERIKKTNTSRDRMRAQLESEVEVESERVKRSNTSQRR